MKNVYYYTNGEMFWRFRAGKPAECRFESEAGWTESLFSDIDDLLADTRDTWETTGAKANAIVRNRKAHK